MDTEKIEKIHSGVISESEFIKRLVDTMVFKYSADLDSFVASVVDNLKLASSAHTMDAYTDDVIQHEALQLPTILYFAGNGLEDLGAENSVAEYKRKELYNEAFAQAHGTIPDKKAYAEKLSEDEKMLEHIYDSAYKKLRLKIDHAMKILESLKKVLDLRITKISKGKGWDQLPQQQGGQYNVNR